MPDVVGEARQADRPGEDETDHGQPSRRSRQHPREPGVRSKQDCTREQRHDHQQDVQPEHELALIEGAEGVEEVDESDTDQADDPNGPTDLIPGDCFVSIHQPGSHSRSLVRPCA